MDSLTPQARESLTPRECQVVQLCGHTEVEAARTLGISKQMLHYHWRNIVRKLGLPEKVKYADYDEAMAIGAEKEVLYDPAAPPAFVRSEAAKREFINLCGRCPHCASQNLMTENDQWGSRIVCLVCGRGVDTK